MILKHRKSIGREQELAALQASYDAKSGGQLVMVYGRRRIGKSYLLETFSRLVPAIFYQANYDSAELQLAAFTRLVRDHENDDGLPPGYIFPSWETALEYLAKQKRKKRLVVILDEFPYLAADNPALPSSLQRWWDRHGKDAPIMLILCGSAQTFMTSLERASAPLHQRFTRKLHVGPLHYRDAAKFTPALSAEDCARVYGILGGTPLYLEQWDQTQTIKENLLHLFSVPSSMLVDSAELVLTTDLLDSRAAFRVLQAVGDGKRRAIEIRDTADVTHERLLPRLVELGLLDRRVPATEDPLRSKRSTYEIRDPYFRFYFRFISRNRGNIDRHLGVPVITNRICPFLDDYMGPIFEEMARDYAWRMMAAGEFEGDSVGSWSTRDGQSEVDILGTLNRKTVTFAGSVKWRAQKLDERELGNLRRHARSLIDDRTPLLLVGRGGVEASVTKNTGVVGRSIKDMYAL